MQFQNIGTTPDEENGRRFSALGLMAGAAYLGGTATIAATDIGAGISIGGALGIAAITSGSAYALSYSIDVGANNMEFSFGKMAGNSALGMGLGAANFGIGFALGFAGMAWPKGLKSSGKVARFLFRTIYKSIAFGGVGWTGRRILR